MAHANRVPPAGLDDLVKDLTDRLPALGEKFRANRFQISMGIPVFLLRFDTLHSIGSDSLDELAVGTRRWHHQVYRQRREAVAFARSVPPEPGDTAWSIAEIFQSEAASRLQATMTWIDRLAGDPLVRLLEVPSFFLYAFWLSKNGADQVVVAELPEREIGLRTNHLYTAAEFLGALRRARPIVGIQV